MKKEFIDDLGIILTQKKLINLDDLYELHKKFEDKEDVSFEDYLLEEGIVSKEDLLNALSEYYGVPYFDVIGAFFEHNNIRLVPKGVMLRHLFIPYKVDNDDLTVIAANPKDPNLRPVIGQYLDHHFVINVGLAKDIRETIEEFYDKSIEYQPNPIASEKMERSQVEVHPLGETIRQDLSNHEIPLEIEETDDDYESK